MRIFLDTEFTGLHERYLISIGMVAVDGRELYVELAGVSPLVCSLFVRETVLPLLDGPSLAPAQVAARVAAFLAPCEGSVTFFSDAPRYDLEMLAPFLPQNLVWTFEVPSFETEEAEEAYRAAREAAFAGGLRHHHALDDARAMAQAWAAAGQP